MREKSLKLLGLMRRANAIAVGEINTGAAAHSGKAKLLVVAEDASDNAKRRARGFAAGQGLEIVYLPFKKAEISDYVGLNGCSMAAIMDTGFAAALTENLAALDPEGYTAVAQYMAERRSQERQRQAEATRQRNKRNGKRRNSV